MTRQSLSHRIPYPAGTGSAAHGTPDVKHPSRSRSTHGSLSKYRSQIAVQQLRSTTSSLPGSGPTFRPRTGRSSERISTNHDSSICCFSHSRTGLLVPEEDATTHRRSASAYYHLMNHDARSLFMDLATYNQRANSEMFEALSALSPTERSRNGVSWFGSAHALLNHAIIAHFFWLRRFRPVFPVSRVLNDPRLELPDLSWQRNLADTLDELSPLCALADDLTTAWFSECPTEAYGEVFEYVDSEGVRRKAVAMQAFEFLFVHEIHHRGQIAQILDERGVPNNFADTKPFLDVRN